MKKKKENRLFISILICFSFCISVFYFFFNNLDLDNNILFLGNKLFFGDWLRKGIFPLYNPYSYAGTPFAFDIGLGNMHPINLLFILPFPYSFSVWVFVVTALFLVGFYLFFKTQTRTLFHAFSMTLLLFFSGSGLMRINNPFVYICIAHIGSLLYLSVAMRERQTKKYQILFYLSSISLLFSGHFQMAFYIYVFIFLANLFVIKVPRKTIVIQTILHIVSISGYLILSFPIIVESTRLVAGQQYAQMGKVLIPQYLQFAFPFIFGMMSNGSKWNVGSMVFILSSITYSFFFLRLIVRRQIKRGFLFIIIMLFIISGGFIPIPLLRMSSQCIVFIHVLLTWLFCIHEDEIYRTAQNLEKKVSLFISISGTVLFIFCVSPLFTSTFTWFYLLVRKTGPGLFFDPPTIRLVGWLIGISLAPSIVFLWINGLANSIGVFKNLLFFFLLIEGFFLQAGRNYYIPQSVFQTIKPLSSRIDTINYRVQTASDVVPFFGYQTYLSNVLTKPPVSKEIPYVDTQEEIDRKKLSSLMRFFPGLWNLPFSFRSIQAFSTFLPTSLHSFFETPSANYKEEYKHIIEKNPLFGERYWKTTINEINFSTVTLSDPRWSDLAVKYFITQSPLAYYRLVEKDDEKYIYENENAKPIYTFEDDSKSYIASPIYSDPNKSEFSVGKKEVGTFFVARQATGGVFVTINGRRIPSEKEPFRLKTLLTEQGKLTVGYSPLLHLQERLDMLIGHTKRTPKGMVFIINQVRGDECCQNGSVDVYKRQIDSLTSLSLPATFLFRYDAIQEKYVKEIKNNRFFIPGIFLEITPSLVQDAGLRYKGTVERWYRAKDAYLVGYTQEERKKIIDTVMQRYYKHFGTYPLITGSWMVDAWSARYLYEKFGVRVHEITKEQYGTDSYILYGGPYNVPYIADKKWVLLPRKDQKQNGLVVVRQTIADPVYNYGDTTSTFTSQPNDYMRRGNNISYFRFLLTQALTETYPQGFAVVGLENSLEIKYQDEYEKQLQEIEKLRKNYPVSLVDSTTLEQMNAYTNVMNLYAGKSQTESSQEAFWVGSNNFRVRLIRDGSRIFITDVRRYEMSLADPYETVSLKDNVGWWIVSPQLDASNFAHPKDKTYLEKPKYIIDSLLNKEVFDSMKKSVVHNDFLTEGARIELPFLAKGELTYSYNPNIISFSYASAKGKQIVTFTQNAIQTIPSIKQVEDILSMRPIQQKKSTSSDRLKDDKNIFSWTSYKIIYNATRAMIGRNPARIVLVPQLTARIRDFENIQIKSIDGYPVQWKVHAVEDQLSQQTGMYYVDIFSDKEGVRKLSLSYNNQDLLLEPFLFAYNCRTFFFRCIKEPVSLWHYILLTVTDKVRKK